MDSDMGLIVLAFLFYWFTLVLLRNKVSRYAFWFNFVINIIYSLYFLYGMFYKGQGGASLGWFLSLVFILTIHSVINLLLLLYLSYQR